MRQVRTPAAKPKKKEKSCQSLKRRSLKLTAMESSRAAIKILSSTFPIHGTRTRALADESRSFSSY